MENESDEERKCELWEVMECDSTDVACSWNRRRDLAIRLNDLGRINCFIVRTDLFINRESYPADLIVDNCGNEIPRLLLIYLTSLYEQKTTTYRDEMFGYLIAMHPKLLFNVKLNDILSYLSLEYVMFAYRNGIMIEVDDIENLFRFYDNIYDMNISLCDPICDLIDCEIIRSNIDRVYSILGMIERYVGNKFPYYKALLRHGDKELIKYAIQRKIDWIKECVYLDYELKNHILYYSYDNRKLELMDVIDAYTEMGNPITDLISCTYYPIGKDLCVLSMMVNHLGIDKVKEIYGDSDNFKKWYDKMMSNQAQL